MEGPQRRSAKFREDGRASWLGWLADWRRGRDGTACWGLRPRQASVACRPSPCQHLRVSRQFSRSHRLTLFGNFDRFGLRRRVIRLTLVWIRFFYYDVDVIRFPKRCFCLWGCDRVYGWVGKLWGEGLGCLVKAAVVWLGEKEERAEVLIRKSEGVVSEESYDQKILEEWVVWWSLKLCDWEEKRKERKL